MNAVDALAIEHMPMVRKLAEIKSRRMSRHIELDDLIGAGNLGLMQAAKRFDPSQGVKFSTYAALRVAGAIDDYLRQTDSLVRDTRIRKRAERLGKHIPVASQLQTIKSHGSEQWDDEGEIDYDAFVDDAAQDGFAEVDEHDSFERRLRGLYRRERTIMRLLFCEDLTMEETGQAVGLSESRVSQIVSGLLRQFRARMIAA